MEIRKDHELHTRRFGRNMGLGSILLAFVVIIFGVTIVKLSKFTEDTMADRAGQQQVEQGQ